MFENSHDFRVENSTFTSVQGNQIVNINAADTLGVLKKWLAAPDPSTNHNIARKRHHKNTCQWLLQDSRYVAWKEQTNSFMWINGISGCGKTFICSTIIEDVRAIVKAHPGSGLSFFYFDMNDKEKQTPKSLLSLLVLSFTASSGRHSLLEELYDKNDKLYSPAESDLLDLLKEVLNGFTQSYIIIDALDECVAYDELFEILQVIHGWQLSHFHMLVTSRREQNILITMEELMPLEICISADLIGSDIVSYIDFAVGKEQKLRRWGPAVQRHIKDNLTSGSNGMFRWVACQIEELKFCHSQSAIIDALQHLPKSLEATYDQILQRINEREMPYIKILLHWLVLSMCPLTFMELAAVVTFDPQTGVFHENLALEHPHDIMEICSSLVTTGADDTIILAHSSVKEYFLAKPRTLQCAEISVSDTSIGHGLIAQCCLGYLLQDGWYNIGRSAEFPLLKYSIQFWPDHYKLSKNNPILHDLVMMLFQIEDAQFIHWVKLHHKNDAFYRWFHGEWSPFFHAGLLGLDEILKRLIESNTWSMENGKTLQIAAFEGHTSAVKVLLDSGVNPNLQYGLLDNALQAASFEGHVETTKLLLSKGADVNSQGGEYSNALQAACLRGHTEIVRLLLDMGADVNAHSMEYGNALHAAAFIGNTEVVKLLLDKGANVEIQGGRTGNALQAVSLTGHVGDLKLPICKRASMDAQHEFYGNTLHIASYKGHTEIVKLLLDKGVAGADAYTGALHVAAAMGRTELVKLFLHREGPASCAISEQYGHILHVASFNGHIGVIELLLNSGIDVNDKSNVHGSPLQVASYIGDTELVRLFLHRGADVNIQGGRYGNALLAALSKNNKELIEILLANGAEVIVNNENSGRALCSASFIGHTPIVEILLKKKCVNFNSQEYVYALNAASTNGHTAAVQLLLQETSLVNVQSHIYATLNGHIDIVKLLLEKGVDVNAVNKSHGTSLCAASYSGHTDIVNLLLIQGADVNMKGGQYGNPLQAACLNKHPKIIMLLLQHGADVNAQGGQYGSALQATLHKSNTEVLKFFQSRRSGEVDMFAVHNEIINLLLENGVDVNIQSKAHGSALYTASMLGQVDVVKLLLSKGANINIQGGKHGNALNVALHMNWEEVISILLAHGADLNVHEQAFNSLHTAIYHCSAEIVKHLLDKGVDINAFDQQYGGIIQSASQFGRIDLVTLLLDRGFDVNVQGGEHGNALQAALINGHFDIAKVLLNHGANVNAQVSRTANTLQMACLIGDEEIVSLILAKGANVNVQGGRYGSALQAASLRGHIKIVALLLEKGADVNIQDGEYGNALQAASVGGHVEIVRLLLDNGADVNAKGGPCGSALQAAKGFRHFYIAKILLEWGATAI